MNASEKTVLAAEAVGSLLTLLPSLTAINAFSFIYEGSYYSFTLPTVVAAAVCLLSSVLGLSGVLPMRVAFWSAVPVGSVTFLAAAYALSRWPGGDDGPGMFWMLFVGSSSAVLSLLSIVLLFVGIIAAVRNRRVP